MLILAVQCTVYAKGMQSVVLVCACDQNPSLYTLTSQQKVAYCSLIHLFISPEMFARSIESYKGHSLPHPIALPEFLWTLLKITVDASPSSWFSHPLSGATPTWRAVHWNCSITLTDSVQHNPLTVFSMHMLCVLSSILCTWLLYTWHDLLLQWI